MQLGFVGLGKMGGNMVHRIHRDSDHEVVAFDFCEDAVKEAESHGASGVVVAGGHGLEARSPRAVWIMVPAGDPTQRDGGQARRAARRGRHDHRRRQLAAGRTTSRAPEELAPKGIHYVDVGTSGGVWGLEVGYCMMVGGPDEAVERLSPILDVLAPPSTDEHGPGWGHMGDTGAGHYVKMVHNGVEYGIMQAYAEGFELFDVASSSSTTRRSPTSGCRARWSAPGCASWPRYAFEQEGNDLAGLEGHVRTPARAAGRSRTRSTRTCRPR